MDSNFNSQQNWGNYEMNGMNEMNENNFMHTTEPNMNQVIESEMVLPTESIVRSKTEFVRQILNEIGAVSEKEPPEGWVQEVEKRLAQNNLKMHRNTIYFTRRNMLKSQGKKNANAKSFSVKVKKRSQTNSLQAPHFSKDDTAASKAIDRPVFSHGHISALREVQKLAQKFGGLRQLAEAIDFLVSIKDNRS